VEVGSGRFGEAQVGGDGELGAENSRRGLEERHRVVAGGEGREATADLRRRQQLVGEVPFDGRGPSARQHRALGGPEQQPAGGQQQRLP
jgi:hypothetical protein